jgi:dolichol kinase
MSVVEAVAVPGRTFEDRRRTADRIFQAALLFNASLTAFWLYAWLTRTPTIFFGQTGASLESLGRVAVGFFFFYVVWGFIWWAIKNAALKYIVGMTKEDRKRAFSSRMKEPYDVAELLSRYSERRIRIADMIGRRGRFMFLAFSGFFYLYANQRANPTSNFVLAFTQDNLFDAVIGGWMFLSFYYVNGFIAGTVFGPQSRIMDGVLGRANNLLITTLWTAFKFVLVPIGAQLAVLYRPSEFAVVFALIWGSYIVCDAAGEVCGSLFGKQAIKVWGVGDVNRKSVAGTVCGFLAALTLCVSVVLSHSLPASWLALAVVISVTTTVLELWSPRGTDDFTMATANALICWGFGLIR